MGTHFWIQCDIEIINECNRFGGVSQYVDYPITQVLRNQSNQEESTECKLKCHFRDQSIFNKFLNCSKNDLLTIAIFQLYGCEFYLECTPNGWDREGQCSVWLNSKCGMFGIKSITVAFTVECKEIGFKSENSRAVISDRGNGGESSVTTTHTMDRKQFNGISHWTFECLVEILEVHYHRRLYYSRYTGYYYDDRRVVIEKRNLTNIEENKQKELGEKEESRKHEEPRKKKKEKRKRQNETIYERRELKRKDNRIKRKMRKYKGKELKKAMF